MTASPLLSVEGLGVELLTGGHWRRVVRDVSFSVAADEAVGIVGESGCGKTVTSLAIMGLLPHRTGRLAGGRVLLGDVELTGMSQRRLTRVRGNDIAMVFQDPMSTLNPAFTVGEQIAETVRRHRHLSRAKARAAAVDALRRVHIPNAEHRARAYPHEFSGGMCQRASLAMALSCSPRVLIADEPTTALDVTIQAQLLELIHELRRELSMAIVFITHDLGVVADVCDRVIVMYAGEIVETADVGTMYDAPLHPYTHALLRAAPALAETAADLHVIPGQPPVPGAMPEGCRFHPRCEHRQEACLAGDVPLRSVTDGHLARCLRAGELSRV